MPTGNEGSHVFDGVTIRGGLQIGDSNPVFIAGGDNFLSDGGNNRLGIETFSRFFATSSAGLTSQTMRLSYFRAPFSLLATTVAYSTVATAAAATPTVIRYGIYSRNAGGDITLIGSTASDLTLLTSINTEYPKALSVATQLVGGQRYALGILVVSATTMPAVPLNATIVGGMNVAAAGPVGGTVAAQADLPASVAYGSISAGNAVYGYVA